MSAPALQAVFPLLFLLLLFLLLVSQPGTRCQTWAGGCSPRFLLRDSKFQLVLLVINPLCGSCWLVTHTEACTNPMCAVWSVSTTRTGLCNQHSDQDRERAQPPGHPPGPLNSSEGDASAWLCTLCEWNLCSPGSASFLPPGCLGVSPWVVRGLGWGTGRLGTAPWSRDRQARGWEATKGHTPGLQSCSASLCCVTFLSSLHLSVHRVEHEGTNVARRASGG